MRFLPGGADIPDDLIHAVRAGAVVFLCGAGVSRRAGMPSFEMLTEQIYEHLGETRLNDAPEREAFDRKEYDRVLRGLEKRTHWPGSPNSRVREAVAALLAVKEETKFPDHLALLELSRDADGRPRLLTTNFETLFERASAVAGMTDVPSHAGKSLPRPGGALDHGVLHLHGRIADPHLNLDGTDLVLTSSDFGDAYLRDGWASRYIEDRMRLDVLVLVGYAAEDAALRLLLETLDADRERFRDMKVIYAIEKGGMDTAAFWQAKGIRPIEFTGYDEIYATLAEWARFAAKPVEYRRERLKQILAKLPADTDEFEREQLRFLLRMDDFAATLADLNPSLAWMPLLAEWRLVGFDEPRLAAWIERNFASVEAIREVVASVGLLGPDAAALLEFRLQAQEGSLPPLLASCWRLILRQMRNAKRGLERYEWLDLQPRVKRGEHSAELVERLAGGLRPKVTIKRRLSIRGEDTEAPAHPSDLMSIDYKVEDEISAREVLEAWPKETASETDKQLLEALATALDATLADAVDIGVEGGDRWGTTDLDVPSVADHCQNSHRSGFQAIALMMADLWSRLAGKDAAAALPFLLRWSKSAYRLDRRLALFACSDPAVPAAVAADVLLALPQGELFLTSSAVEVFRLISARWKDWSAATRDAIQQRLRDGPPADWFRKDEETGKYIDRSRYDLLGQLEAHGLELSAESKSMLDELSKRWPHWIQRPREQAGFGTWHSSSSGVVGDRGKLDGVPDDRLLETAHQVDSEAMFGDGDVWQALCQTDPERALRGLEAEAEAGRWPALAWQRLLWSRASAVQTDCASRIAEALLGWPPASFPEIAGPASFWLDDSFKVINGDLLWKLWDSILDASADHPDETDDDGDLFNRSLNHPAGRLAQILLHEFVKLVKGEELPEELQTRLDRLLAATGNVGKLARVRLAVEISRLYELAPNWTREKLVPLFEWSSPDAPAAWSARKFSNRIGSPELFGLSKRPFLDMFGRIDMSPRDLDVFSSWLAEIMTAKQAHGASYPLTFSEARVALRRAGASVLSGVGHRLALEMEAAGPAQKVVQWRNVVGPVFSGMWPLDVDLQSSSSTFSLVQILRATGDAFPEAVDVILPYIQPEQAGQHSTVFSLAEADEALFKSAPAKMLDLIGAVVGDAPRGRVYSLRKALDKVRAADSELAETRRFQKLLALAGPT